MHTLAVHMTEMTDKMTAGRIDDNFNDQFSFNRDPIYIIHNIGRIDDNFNDQFSFKRDPIYIIHYT